MEFVHSPESGLSALYLCTESAYLTDQPARGPSAQAKSRTAHRLIPMRCHYVQGCKHSLSVAFSQFLMDPWLQCLSLVV
jgi:hypothetical protein